MKKPRKIFSQIYDQYIDKIYRFIFFKVNSEEVARDLTSEVFLRFWESLNNLNEIENARAFLYQIARNLVVDHYREKNRFLLVSIEDKKLQDPNVDLERSAHFDSELKKAYGALSNLKGDYQDVIIWYYLDEIPVKEIAEMLNKSENAVRLVIHRALKSLQDNLLEEQD